MKKQLSRRRFAQLGTAAWSAFAAGCGQDQRDLILRGSGGSGGMGSWGQGSGGEGTGGAIDAALGGMGGAPRTCGDLTAANIQGPFFLSGSPERTDIRGNMPGAQLLLTGRIYDTNCLPIAGALVDFWQADVAGAYDEDGSTFRGHQFTPEGGAYSLSTIIPGRYLNGAEYRPAHVHVKITTPGYVLVTQLYFPDDPFNDVDSFFLPELVVDVADGGGDIVLASFDFYLPPAP